LKESERLVALIVDTVRSQLAAIAGNVLIALPLAIAIGTAAQTHWGHLFAAPKAGALLAEIDPLTTPSLLYAGVAGVWLFVAGLVSGYVDNMSAYAELGARVGRIGWLVKLLGEEGADSLGSYLDRNAGGLAGNIFFGFALGMTPAVGKAFGLPLDIRHIAFSAATLGYALTALDWKLPLVTLVRCLSGVAMIGLVNLAVSFALALRVALRSRGVLPHQGFALLRPRWRTLLRQPAKFLYPAGK
jgi:site-specific recombinase